MEKKRFSLATILLLSVLITGGLGVGPLFSEPVDEQSSQAVTAEQDFKLSPIEKLGKLIFFDQRLSLRDNQSCAACHGPNVGWTGPDASLNALGAVYMGSVGGRFGNRKPPSAAYAGFSPVLKQDETGSWRGGLFWDGRATGLTLGDPLAEQAQGPFLNPLEQALPGAANVVNRVCRSAYAGLFNAVWGNNACSDVNKAYENIARSIAAYERSVEVTQFTSKYDFFLKGQAKLTAKEAHGLILFNGKGKCASCHLSAGVQDPKRPIFTDFTFDNLGVPKNPLNPFYYNFAYNPQNVHWVDLGLGGFLNDPTQNGKQQVPTLRNAGKKPSSGFVKAYSHNGYFKSLDAIVHFYNTRDVLPACSDPLAIGDDPGVNCWPAPEVSENVNRTELGNLGLTVAEEGAIVAFLKTLSDGWSPPQP